MPKAHRSVPVLGLQETIGNRAVQRILADDKSESSDSGVIQRYLAPGIVQFLDQLEV